eukprot:scaffold386296_cov23-Prasinocladus_malaysianus.AAC.1
MSPGRVYPRLAGNSSSQKTSWHRHDSVTLYSMRQCGRILTYAITNLDFADVPLDSAELHEKNGSFLGYVSQ